MCICIYRERERESAEGRAVKKGQSPDATASELAIRHLSTSEPRDMSERVDMLDPQHAKC